MDKYDSTKKINFLKNDNIIYFTLFALFLLRFLWPGDSAFINDEPLFVNLGFEFLQTLDPMTLGLQGKTGVKYGPYTAWFFGLLLAFSKNLIIVTYLKIFIVSSITIIAGLWIIRSVESFKVYYLLPVFTSLYLYNYSRLLWDLNISMTFMALAAYISFVKKEKYTSLMLAVICSCFATLIHLMCLPFVLSIASHFLIFKIKWIKGHLFKALFIIVIICLIAGPYYHYVITTPKTASDFEGTTRSFFYGFFGARFLTTFDFSYFMGKKWQLTHRLPHALDLVLLYSSFLTWFAYPLSWFGAYKAYRLVKKKEQSLLFHICVISLMTITLHIIISFVTNLRTHPHYYDGVWTASLMLIWVAISFLEDKKYFNKFFAIYTLASVIYLIEFITLTHLNNGSRYLHYGPTLKNQMEIAKELNQLPESVQIEREAFHPKTFPHTIKFLQKLDRTYTQKSKDNHNYKKAYIKYKSDDKKNGELILIKER